MTVFMIIKHWEESNRHNEFKYKALDHAAAIQSEFEHLTKNIVNMRFLIEHDINIEHENPNNPDAFMPMVTALIQDDSALLSVAWAIAQPDAQHLQHLKITYLNKTQHHDNNSDMKIGDLYDKHIAVASILDTKQLITSLIHNDGDIQNNELNFIAPVANRMQENNQFSGKHIGSLIVEMDLNDLIEHALSKIPVAAQDISLAILHANGSRQPVYKHLSRSRQGDEAADQHTGLSTTIEFTFTGLTWQLEFEAAPKFFRTHSIILAWQSLIFCLLLTLFFTWYAHFSRQQARLIEQEVVLRTKELQQNKNKLRRIIDHLQDVYFQTDAQGNIEACSASIINLTGYHEHEVIGTPISVLHRDPNFLSLLFQAMQHDPLGQVDNFECESLRKDGHQLWTSSNAQFLYNEQQQIIGIEGTIRDITAKKHATEEKEGLQRQIEHTQRLESLGVLAGGIAHDFNNILAAIMGNASLADNKVFDRPHDSKEHLEKIISASEKAALLCQQMLAYAGKGRFIIEPINLSNLLDEITQLLDISIAPNVSLAYQLQDHLPHIDGDKAQLQQLFMNFTTNANEAITEHGDILITTGTRDVSIHDLQHYLGSDEILAGNYVYVSVRDNGCGMDQATIEKIFDPFFTTKFTGRGLGMSAVLGIMKGHRGFIHCESSPGNGTTFTVLFPIGKQQPALKSHAVPPLKAPQQTSGMVLVIDDDEAIREIAQAMLEDSGWDAICASDGKSGIDQLSQHQDKITAVILDMTMPGMDGLATFEALKDLNSNIKVILSTGYSEQEASDRFAGKGLAGFLQKPYSLEQLQQQIDKLVA